MKHNIKKMVCLILALVISLGISAPAFADKKQETTMLQKDSGSLSDICASYALKWIHKVASNDKYKVNCVTEIYNSDDTLTGYDVSFTKKGNPSGYAIIDFRNSNNYVAEYALDGPDLAQKLRMKASSDSKITIRGESASSITKLYRDGIMQYSAEMSVDNKMVFLDTTKGIVQKSEFEQQRALVSEELTKSSKMLLNNNFSDSIVEASNRIGTMVGTEKTLANSKSVGYVGDRSYPSQFASRIYGCTPTACTNLLYYLENKRNLTTLLIGHNWFKTYDDMFIRLGTYSGWWAGTTLPTFTLRPALTGYARSRGYKSEAITISTLGGIQYNINLGRPIILDYIYAGSGHSIFVFGYCTFKDGSTDHNYFTCANGWDSYPTYFAYDDIGHTNYIFEATAFTMYK